MIPYHQLSEMVYPRKGYISLQIMMCSLAQRLTWQSPARLLPQSLQVVVFLEFIYTGIICFGIKRHVNVISISKTTLDISDVMCTSNEELVQTTQNENPNINTSVGL